MNSGWTVHLMNEGQSTIYQEEEFQFANKLLSESVPTLPKVRIDKFLCKCLKSSLELTKIKVKTDNKGSRTIHKDKSSEALPLASRPMFSTNFSDAFKYGQEKVALGEWDGFNIGLNWGEAAGQTVMYPHIHLIPRRNGDVDDPVGGVRNTIPGKGNYRKS
jgi:hypothetical protein